MTPAVHVAIVHALAVAAVVVTLAGGVVVVGRVLRPWSWAERLAAVVLAAGAVALRLAVPGGPFDINLRSTEVFFPFEPTVWHYGLAYPTLWRALLAPWPAAGFTTLFDGTAVLGGLTAVLLVAFLRVAGTGRRVAWLAGVALALTPAHVRFSHTDVQAIPEAFLFLLAGLAWIEHLDRHRPGVGVGLPVATASLALAATMRPEGVLLLPTFALLTVATGRTVEGRWRQRGVAGLALIGFVALHVAGVVLHNHEVSAGRAGLKGWPSPLVHGPLHWVALDPTFTAPLLVVLALVGGALAPLRGRRHWAWLLLAAVTGCFVLNPDWTPAGRDVPALVRHQVRSLPWFAVLIGFGLDGLARQAGRRWGPVVLVALTAVAGLAAVRALDGAFRPTTLDAEFAFRDAVERTLPAGCAVVTWLPPEDRGLAMTSELSRSEGLDLTWLRLDRGDPLPEAGCVIWYRPASCAAPLDRKVLAPAAPCAAFEASHTLTPIAEARLPNRPWLIPSYAEDPVRVGYYRLR
ncbi:MAG: hypothetical protein H6733_12790 [Alphaproteobacteria bacterium]|nr:hypothetical protein [Alphaproteobacteria bacterium]